MDRSVSLNKGKMNTRDGERRRKGWEEADDLQVFVFVKAFWNLTEQKEQRAELSI